MRLRVFKGDITDSKAAGIIISAGTTLLGGGAVAAAVHRKGGISLTAACRSLQGCRQGEAKITYGYKLPARYVIHAVADRFGAAARKMKRPFWSAPVKRLCGWLGRIHSCTWRFRLSAWKINVSPCRKLWLFWRLPSCAAVLLPSRLISSVLTRLPALPWCGSSPCFFCRLGIAAGRRRKRLPPWRCC